MKKLLSVTLLLLTTLSAKAQVLEAKSMKKLFSDIEKAEFTYKERGMVFGFITIQSCLYLSEDIAIFKNYCYPVKKYPARGYTIISKEYGMIDLYEETLSNALKRDIGITEFPDLLAPYLTTPIPRATLPGLSDMMEKIYHRYYPGCWSSNYNFDTGLPVANCTNANEVVNFEAWANETQEILNNEEAWFDLMNMIEAKLK